MGPGSLSERTPAGKSARRGQTNLDFVVGVSVLLVAVIFVWMFLPNLFAPFTGGNAAERLAADRVANQLTEDFLGAGAAPQELDEDCTVAFFGGGVSIGSSCGFSAGDPLESLGVDSGQSIAVTIQADNDGDGTIEPLCWKGQGMGGFVESDACAGPTLTIGPEPGDTSEVSAARRVISIDGQRAVIVVRVW